MSLKSRLDRIDRSAPAGSGDAEEGCIVCAAAHDPPLGDEQLAELRAIAEAAAARLPETERRGPPCRRCGFGYPDADVRLVLARMTDEELDRAHELLIEGRLPGEGEPSVDELKKLPAEELLRLHREALGLGEGAV